MIFDELNATHYRSSLLFYNAEFEDVLRKIILCYGKMLSAQISLIDDENRIRDVLLIDYLRNNTFRKELDLTDYLFDREVPEDRTAGRTDIKIQTVNTFKDTSAYYIIECKRLNGINTTGTSGFNAKYVNNGIARFALKTYSTHRRTNGMIAFITEKIDIDRNISCINQLLEKEINISTLNKLTRFRLASDFDYSYTSTHGDSSHAITLYHLMLDVSSKIVHRK